MKHKKGSYKQIQERHPSKENSALHKAYRAGRSGGAAAGVVEKPLLLSHLFGQSRSLTTWSHGELGRPTVIFAGIMTEETEIDYDFCQNKAQNKGSE